MTDIKAGDRVRRIRQCDTNCPLPHHQLGWEGEVKVALTRSLVFEGLDNAGIRDAYDLVDEPVKPEVLTERPEPMLRWFAFSHLPDHLQFVSKAFHDLAIDITTTLPGSAERTVALRKLLESKDAAVRAAVDSMPTTTKGTS